jgi:hypothetical protein
LGRLGDERGKECDSMNELEGTREGMKNTRSGERRLERDSSRARGWTHPLPAPSPPPSPLPRKWTEIILKEVRQPLSDSNHYTDISGTGTDITDKMLRLQLGQSCINPSINIHESLADVQLRMYK